MIVYKFGGASINSIDRIKNVADIISKAPDGRLFIIISAMGKTTNALEKIAEAFYEQRRENALQLFEQVKQQHLTTAKYLLVKNYLACESQLNDFFTEVEWLLHDKPVRSYDYYYDQIVCCGELLSTCIVSHFLNESGIINKWIDVRDILRTDDNFRDAAIDWNFTAHQVKENVLPLFNKYAVVITQGFIGSTADNESTTLGREGSDFSAAIFANLLEAKNQTIWKDVPSVMNADPRKFNTAVELPELSYNEVIEMAYYGAQVIHPKTIKPLYQKKIPLIVKCFLDPDLPGTIINNTPVKQLPPVIILKENQVMMFFKSKDYSFAGDHAVGELYKMMEAHHLKPNMTQIGAISFTAVYDDWKEKLEQLAIDAESLFDVQLQKGLTILTVRHYTSDFLNSHLDGKKALLTQQTPETIQVVY